MKLEPSPASGPRRPHCLLLLFMACQPDGAEPANDSPGASGGSGAASSGNTAASAALPGGAGGGEETELAGAAQGGSPTSEAGQPNSAGEGPAGATNQLAAGGACGTGVDEGDCASCLRGACCAQWSLCEADDDCSACASCLDEHMDLGTCVVMSLCDIAPQATSELLLCGLTPCETECGFD